MAITRSFYAFAFSSLIISSSARIAPLRKAHQHHKHEAVEVGKRQKGPPFMGPPPEILASTTAQESSVLMMFTPAPGAEPTAIFKQSEILTTYVPHFTLCELPPLEFFSVTQVPSATPRIAPYRNYSISIPPGNGTCTTIYSPTITEVCRTTLTALVDKYTVSNCNQEITFSTKYGYVLSTPTSTIPTLSSTRTSNTTALHNATFPRALLNNTTAMITPAPSIETLTSYYIAPWTELTAGTAPADVDLKVCRTFTNGSEECIREYQVWETSLVTLMATSMTSINISTTIQGPSKVIVETVFATNVTELFTTFSFSTTMATEFQTEYTTTRSAPRSLSTSTGSTVYETMTVEKASYTRPHTTSTTTIHLTETVHVGTSTVTLESGSTSSASTPLLSSTPSTPASTSVNFASMLGIGS